MFVCCKKPENGCTGVPDCKCKCSGCQDEWDRFSADEVDEYANTDPEDDGGEPDEDSAEADTWGCHFPETCVMPDRHLKSECHTGEMLADQQE